MRRISLQDRAALGSLFFLLASFLAPTQACAQTHPADTDASAAAFIAHERPRVLSAPDDRYVPHHWVPFTLRTVMVRHRVNASPTLLARTRAERFHAERRFRYDA
jgi:hypothetical protein